MQCLRGKVQLTTSILATSPLLPHLLRQYALQMSPLESPAPTLLVPGLPSKRQAVPHSAAHGAQLL